MSYRRSGFTRPCREAESGGPAPREVMMSGLWVFLIIAVVFGTIGSVARAAISRGKASAAERELESLRVRVAELEAAHGDHPALPPHQEGRVDEIEQRLQSLETIVTGADELLEQRLREAARDQGKRSD